MYMASLAALTRKELIKIAETSEVANTKKVQEFIAKLIRRGQYTEATEDEIEEYDTLYERLAP